MTTILELREKRAKTWETAKGFLDTHRNEKGTLSAEDDAVYARMEQDITDLGKEIARLERQQALDAELSKPVSTPITQKPEAKKTEKKGRASESYSAAFWNQMRSVSSPEIRNALREGNDADGGFLVPDTFEATLISALEDELVIRQKAHVFKTSCGDTKLPVVSAKGSAAWTDEAASIPETAETYAQKSIGSHKLTALIKVSEELLSDSAFDLEAHFRAEFARQIGNAEETAFISGDGTDRPYGIFHATEGAMNGVTAASATAITADELIDLYHSLGNAYRRNAVWLLNDSTIQAIRKLKDDNKQYLWQPGLHIGDPDTILGKAVLPCSAVPAIASGANAIAFGDLSFYWIGDREGINFRRLNELYAGNGQIGFLATKRLDARLILPEAIKTLKMAA